MQKIFVVDDNNASLTACKKILKPHYEVYPIPSAEKMFETLGHVVPDLILLDVDMPDMNGYEAAGRLKKNEIYSEIPIIFLSGRIDPTSEMVGLNLGALDYIHKPFVSELLLRRIKTNMSMIDAPGKPIDAFKELLAPVNDIIGILGAGMGTDDPVQMKDSIAKADSAAKQLLTQIKNNIEN